MNRFPTAHPHRFIVLLPLLLWLAVVQPADAQAILILSTPPAGAQLDSSPPSVVLEFSSELDRSFSQAQLFDSQNRLIEPGPGSISPLLPRTLHMILPDLPQGSYTVVWRVRSAIDGQITSGRIPFGIGVAATGSAFIPALGTPDPATEQPPLLDSVLRGIILIAALLTLSGLAFVLFIWYPALRTALAIDPGSTHDVNQLLLFDQALTHCTQRGTRVGSGLFLIASLAWLIVQTALAANVALPQALGIPLLQLLSERSGLLALARIALIFQIGVLAWRLPTVGTTANAMWWSLLLVGCVALITISMTSAAATAANLVLAVGLDWLHLVTIIIWLGVLLPLAFTNNLKPPLPARIQSDMIRRYVWLTAICMVLIALTSSYSYLLHVEQLELLTATTYGRLLLGKFILIGLLLVGSMLFTRVVKLRAHILPGMLLIAVLLLLSMGAMASSLPSNIAWVEHEQLGIAKSATVDGVELTLRIAPAQVGENEFAIDVVDPRPGATSAATTVRLSFDMQGMDMEEQHTEAQRIGQERYFARGVFTSMNGRWHILVVLQRAGFDDVQHTFEMDIVKGGPFLIQP